MYTVFYLINKKNKDFNRLSFSFLPPNVNIFTVHVILRCLSKLYWRKSISYLVSG